MAEDDKRYAMICRACGSDEVSRDAWADWDTGKQEWVLRCAFDAGFCHRCGCASRLIEVEVAAARA